MAGSRRTKAQIAGAAIASSVVSRAGAEIRESRRRRRLKQTALAGLVGISQARLADIEAGRGGGAPAELWFALAKALDRYLKFEFGRDPLQELADAGHLDMEELVLRVSAPGGWEGGFELATKPADPSRSIDVPLVNHHRRRLVVSECWNTFGNLNAAVRSSDKKVVEAAELMLGRTGESYEIGLVWIVRDTKANRALVAKYDLIFATRFPGSSAAWVKALTTPDTTMPAQPGLVWSDVRATRLFARRRPR